MEVSDEIEDIELKTDVQELKIVKTESFAKTGLEPESTKSKKAQRVRKTNNLSQEDICLIDSSLESNVSSEVEKSEEKSEDIPQCTRVKRKKKKRKGKHNELDCIDSRRPPSPISKAEIVSKVDNDLFITDFEVQISSFNLSKPVMLNLDTYRIETSVLDIESIAPKESILPESTENLEISLDPNLFFPELLEDSQVIDLDEDNDDDDGSDCDIISTPEKIAEVSLLTSSDEDDVILQEPHIETIDVSDACSDDEPLAKLFNIKLPSKRVTRSKKKPKKYTCRICNFWSYTKRHYDTHLTEHDRYLCSKCDFKCSTERKLNSHYRTHIFSFLVSDRRKRGCSSNNRSKSCKIGTVKNKKRKKRVRIENRGHNPSLEI